MKTAIVVTSIAHPTQAMHELAEGVKAHGYDFFCVGDEKSPDTYNLTGCKFVSLREQMESAYEIATLSPTGHYARKNIGYLMAMSEGADRIVETDDDNRPLLSYWQERHLRVTGRIISCHGWVNAYSYFTDRLIWPRGFPLEFVQRPGALENAVAEDERVCPVQQGLANGDPDVDAVFRLTRKLPFMFEFREPIILEHGNWCPFNSQNTVWWKQAFPLMYLPSQCSFRMTDIWRSLVSQACMWPNGWHVAFYEPTVLQERNQHDLLRDFEDEIPGYLSNHRIVEEFSNLPLVPGEEYLFSNMRVCYEVLVSMVLVGSKELELLEAWRRDLKRIAGDQGNSCGVH